jgi:glycosyltransferase involved in cell wall biosynthesis
MYCKRNHPQTEIIAIENGSTEDMSFLEEYDIILRHSETGVSYARNLGLDIATGDYICFIDNDDWIPGYYLDVIYDRIKSGKDWYIWQWYSDDTFDDMSDLDLNDPLKKQWALWGYCWNRKMFDGVRFDIKDAGGDAKVFDILAKETKGELIEKPMYRYYFLNNVGSITWKWRQTHTTSQD